MALTRLEHGLTARGLLWLAVFLLATAAGLALAMVVGGVTRWIAILGTVFAPPFVARLLTGEREL